MFLVWLNFKNGLIMKKIFKINIQEINIKIRRAKKLTKIEQNKYLIPAIMKLNIYKKDYENLNKENYFSFYQKC